MSNPLKLSTFLACVMLFVGVRSAAADEADRFACFPSDDGEQWRCSALDEAGATQPSRSAPPPKPSTTAPVQEGPNEDQTANHSGHAAEDQLPSTRIMGATAEDLDPLTGISRNPQDWFTPTAPRMQLESHVIHADLAGAFYRPRMADEPMCASPYLVREYALPVDTDSTELPIVVAADSLSANLPDTAQLQGNVSVSQGNRHIVAPQMRLDYQNNQAHFDAGLRLDQPGTIMQGASGTVDMGSDDARFEEAQFLLTDVGLRGKAQVLAQNPAGDLLLDKTSFTRCEPGNNGWALTSNSFVARDGEVFATARGAVLKLKSVPIFYSPYLQFPVSDERLSGFLFPNLSYSEEDGTDVSLPYYFNLAPNYDATLIPRYISDRGLGAELELRHMSTHQSTAIGGALLPKDDLFDGTFARDDFLTSGGDAADFEPADRWLGSMDHRGTFGAFDTVVNYTAVSDADYFRDLGSDLGVSSRLELERRGEVRYASGGLGLRLWAQRFQRLDQTSRDGYQRLPELEGIYQTRLGAFEFSVLSKFSRFDRDTDGLRGIDSLTGERVHFEPTLRLPFARSWGFLNVTAGFKYTEYDLQETRDTALSEFDQRPARTIGMGSIDGGLFFERELTAWNTDLVQTLEPRVYLLYQEFEDQSQLPVFDASTLTFGYNQLFRSNRFAGLDRIGDAEQISAGITTRFINATSGQELVRASIGEIFYQRDRLVTLRGSPDLLDQRSNSALAGEVSTQIGAWRLTGNVLWDPYDNTVMEGGGALGYVLDNRHIFNLGYRARAEQDLEQTDMSVYWPLTERLAIFGRWNFDLISKRTIEGFGGLEYSDCCLQIRLLARRFLDSRSSSNFADIEADDGIFVQIVFKGLAGFGTKVESIFERGIRGYRAPQDNGIFAPGLN